MAVVLAVTCPMAAVGEDARLVFPEIRGVTRETRTYKKVGTANLSMTICFPPGHADTDKRPAIVFFFGGGWNSGTPTQFARQCEYLASRGMVAMTADYRVKSRHGVTPDACVMDAKSGIRWARANAATLGIDPNRIVAAGGSAGGHIAAATGTVEGYDEKGEDATVSSVPDALVLFNPVLNTTAAGWGDDQRGASLVARFAGHAEALSPVHHVKKGAPPTLILHGTADTTVPIAQAESFADAMRAAGNRCEVVRYEGQGHGFFNASKGGDKNFLATLVEADKFLSSLGYIEGKPTIVAK
jgi:acetyl esterase/lipase